MPKTRLPSAEARMNQQWLATIDKYKRLANISAYGDLGPKIGRCRATAVNRINAPGAFTLEELRRIVRSLRIPPEEFLPAVYDGWKQGEHKGNMKEEPHG